MLTGPIDATQRLFERTGLGVDDIDVAEINEAFASVVLAWQKELGFTDEQTNPNGGAIALGHPLGGTGAVLLTKALHELERTAAATASCRCAAAAASAPAPSSSASSALRSPAAAGRPSRRSAEPSRAASRRRAASPSLLALVAACGVGEMPREREPAPAGHGAVVASRRRRHDRRRHRRAPRSRSGSSASTRPSRSAQDRPVECFGPEARSAPPSCCPAGTARAARARRRGARPLRPAARLRDPRPTTTCSSTGCSSRRASPSRSRTRPTPPARASSTQAEAEARADGGACGPRAAAPTCRSRPGSVGRRDRRSPSAWATDPTIAC